MDQVEKTLQRHVALVDSTLEKVRDDLEGLQVGLSKTRGEISQLDEHHTGEEVEDVAIEPEPIEAEQPALSTLRKKWEAVQTELERRARDASIDGRTRAKYKRIDRRSYQSLIDVMVWDETLSDEDAALFTTAWQLWTQHRNGRKNITADEINKMEIIETSLRAGR